jgi:hypothetical protein
MGSNTNHNWTEERMAQFRDLYAQELSHNLIGAQMGISRNASIGKAARMGLESRRGLFKPRTATRRQPRKRKIYPRPSLAQHGPFVLDVERFVADMAVLAPVTLMELQDHHCRYPHEKPGEPMMYCGAQKWAGAYCAHHCRIAYRLPERRAA